MQVFYNSYYTQLWYFLSQCIRQYFKKIYSHSQTLTIYVQHFDWNIFLILQECQLFKSDVTFRDLKKHMAKSGGSEETDKSLVNKFKVLVEWIQFLAHLSRRLKWAIVIAHRPSSVRPSSSSVIVRKLSHFRLLLWNRWTEFNETWQEARSQGPLPSLCFSGRS